MDRYAAFTQALLESLRPRQAILGVVALGSMAGRSRVPDVFSDHDFFVIANDPEPFRRDASWLPDSTRIALWFRETPHGCKAVYDDGHLAEYAVFAPEELQVARVNEYRVLLDRERIGERLAELAARTEPPPHTTWLRGMFLSNLLVAFGRARRGEVLSAHWMLAHALRFLVQLRGGGDDNLDPLRRFHDDAIEQAMHLEPAAAAAALLDVYERECHSDARQIAAIRSAMRIPGTAAQ